MFKKIFNFAPICRGLMYFNFIVTSWNTVLLNLGVYWYCTLYRCCKSRCVIRHQKLIKMHNARCSCLLTIARGRHWLDSCSTTTRQLSTGLNRCPASLNSGAGTATSFRPGTGITLTTALRSMLISTAFQLITTGNKSWLYPMNLI